jgi:hypothetical protein
MLKRSMLATCLAILALAVVPAAGQASAYGLEFWGGFDFNIFGQTVRVPGGELYHEISGEGQHVSWDGAGFIAVGNLCDPSIRFSYGYHRVAFNSSVHQGCSHVGVWKYALNRNVPQGTACAALWIYDWRHYITEQCHFVS